jgi:phenylacetate-coenzyme A ligase PaaK-like adenylate-forming protein
MLESGFCLARNMRQFEPDDLVWLQSYAPNVLVAPVNVALSFADQKDRGLFGLPSLKTAIVVLTSIEESPLSDERSDLLWRAFGVPVFEQLRGWDGSVIARECEVHDGLHIDEPAAVMHLREEREIVTGQCECGADTPRLRGISVPQISAGSAAA